MITESLIENLVVPFGRSFLYDITKEVYTSHKDKDCLMKLLYQAIQRSVKRVLPYKNSKMIDAIVYDINSVCKSMQKVDILQIVDCQFHEWGEENLNSKIIAAEIYNTLAVEIMAEPDLCVLISYKMQIALVKEFENMQKQVGDVQSDVSEIVRTTDSAYRLLQKIINENFNATKNVKNMFDNCKFISSTYQEYFIRPLFLERRTRDNKVVTLNDVYIENKFTILDFVQQNLGRKYKGIIQFIEDFIKDNLKSVNYGTTYSFSSSHIKVLFIKGQPGSGKSSLFYYLAYLKSHDRNFLQDYKFYFVKLIELYDANDGILNVRNPLEDIQKQIGIGVQILNNVVIILDGLDEICVARNFDINEYCYNLIRSINKFESLKIIITTRLNYIKISHNDNKNVFNIQLCNLDIFDLKKWLEKYFSIHSTFTEEKQLAERNIEYIKKNENNQLIEILAIPLLFYMIVVSKIDISEITSVGELYDYVFNELKERNYNEEESDFKQKHGVNNKISPKLARQIAIEISKEMYDKNALLLKINSGELQSALNRAYSIEYNLSEKDKQEIEKLFPITFFYKEALDVVEFAHKSIMEFFVAEKLYQAIEEFEGDINSYIDEFILNPIITNEVLNFYFYFFESRCSSNKIIQKYSDFLNVFKKNIYEKRFFSSKNVTYSFEMSKLIFKIYWYFARKIFFCKIDEVINFINEDIIRRYILGVLSINDTGSVALLDNGIITWDFSKLLFADYSFSYCNLEYANFSDASFERCIFQCSNLNYANFNRVIIKSYLQFINCNMQYIRIENLQLDNKVKKERGQDKDNKNCILELKSISLDGAEFINVDFRKIKLVLVVSMERAKFRNVKLTLEQFLLIKKYNSLCENIQVHISIDDLTKSEIREVKKLKKDNRRNDAGKYVEDIIMKKMKSEGMSDDEILNLMIILDKNII
ncbi:MAG: hypothetical protein HFH55_03490 [Lachnospiraceae bacterium]|nr:hypothetical protein [Lachnospiraceae bacterium]